MRLKNSKTLRLQENDKKISSLKSWAATFKNAFEHFFLLKFFPVFITDDSTILFSKHGNIKRWKRWVRTSSQETER